MLREDEIYFQCLEEAEKLRECGYTDIPIEELTEKLIEQIKKDGSYQQLLDSDSF